MEVLVRLREQYVCSSATCRREIEIEIPPGHKVGETQNPRCTCGSKMKKVYSAPVFRELTSAEAILRLGDIGPLKKVSAPYNK